MSKRMFSTISAFGFTVASAVAQSIGTQGPAVTPSQNYAVHTATGGFIWVIAMWVVFALFVAAVLGYESRQPQA